ncbi:MAG: hypothetical protein KTR15_06960 [Phycisphaeraceae bacterium]|nr:hypothetical protein [Phycisphaeraceae bacterium]
MRIVVYSLVLLFALLPLGGCSWIAGAAYMVGPPEKIEAKYDLPDKATLVIVDDPRGLVTSPSTLRRIATATRNVLEIEKVVVDGGFVGQDKLAGYRSELGDRYNKTSLAALAIHLGAKQVIHAEVTGFQMEFGGNVIRPAIGLNVKVFDLDERGRAFPRTQDLDSGDSFGASVYSLQSQMPAEDLTGASASRSIAVRDLADQAGRDIARLFFDWRVPQPGSGLGKPR